MVYRETWSSILATLLVMAAFTFILSSQTGLGGLLTWYGALAVVLLGRAINQLQFTRIKPTSTTIGHWCWRFRLGILATGLVLGSSSLLFFPHIPVAYQIFNVFVLAGISAGALTIFIADHIAFVLYINASLLPAALVSARYDDHLHIGISIMIVIYILLLMRASKNLFDKVIASIRLGYENQVLAERLAREKNLLGNRLGRILNDSSNEIYVLDADTLECLQVNKGARQHLGYDDRDLAGLSILDILTDLDRQAFDELLEPLRHSTQDSVFYHGHHRRRDGSTYPVEIRLQLSSSESPPVVVATALDMSERDEAKRQLIHQANFDPLTDLPNRFFMLSHIEHAFAQARRSGHKAALLFMDLDDFKKVNDTLGHNMGDILLQQAAARIRSIVREPDTPARLGGDEFLILLERLDSVAQAEKTAEALIEAFRAPFTIGSNEIYSSTSIGISLFPDNGTSVHGLMQNADTAMYHAKRNGRCGYQLFSEKMRIATEQRLQMEKHLRQALENGELSLAYQPIIATHSGRIVGAEALLRWTSPELGMVTPDRFIPLAENLGLIGAIGDWVIGEACREAAGWPRVPGRPVYVAVNVSPHQFRSGRLLEGVERALEASRLPVEQLELEITESLLIQDVNQPLEILGQLRARGIRLALDDFGTGYSSLSYLKRFPLQILKIDRSFVKDLTMNHSSETLVETIISMARSLDMEIVAEGVEGRQQLDFLSRRGVGRVQGYYFSAPLPAAEFRSLLEQGPFEGQAPAESAMTMI